jgi:phosphomannomutase
MSTTTSTLTLARAWLDEDPDPVTRDELKALIERVESGDEASAADLADRFAGTLQFGTAGLRGALGAGPNRMNRVVVIRAAAGLAHYLLEQGFAGEAVVIGFDARHNSEVFARDTAEVMAGAGLRALLLPEPLPTPVLAFAIRHTGAVAGVMVTASHNPPQDNGYKVYLGDGSQIVPPADAAIAAAIDAVGPIAELPRGAAPDADARRVLGEDVVEAYLDRATRVLDPATPRALRVVYTPLHGVGWRVLREAFTRAGFAEPIVVAEQAAPDPDFPTVAFPNPEEPGALDLALAAARAEHADVVIANDPDADRCAVAVLDPGVPGHWRMLRGDELGALLAAHLLQRGRRGVYATTIVSSRLLSSMAASAGVAYAETLTGFKWLSKVEGLGYGYEEALGYCVDPEAVRDKDGISAALLAAELTAICRARGESPREVLDGLARQHGLHATRQVSVRVAELARIGQAMDALRHRPPRELAGIDVVTVTDLRDGLHGLPPTDGLLFELAGGARVVIRPSGTEPKIKCYLEVVVEVEHDTTAAHAIATRTLAALADDVERALAL